MKKPDKAQITAALEGVHQLLGENELGDAIARYLLYLHERDQVMEDIVVALDRYLRFGHPEHEHSVLVRLLQKLRDLETTKEEGNSPFGLE